MTKLRATFAASASPALGVAATLCCHPGRHPNVVFCCLPTPCLNLFRSVVNMVGVVKTLRRSDSLSCSVFSTAGSLAKGREFRTLGDNLRQFAMNDILRYFVTFYDNVCRFLHLT